jgi:hypothetical protein
MSDSNSDSERVHPSATVQAGASVTEGWATDEQVEAHFRAWQEGGEEGLLKYIKEQQVKSDDQAGYVLVRKMSRTQHFLFRTRRLMDRLTGRSPGA